VRRFFLTQQPFGKRAHPLRVLARAYITPKVAVALLEVPGKLLVVGVTGSTLVSLGEVATEAVELPQPETAAQPLGFAAALAQSVQALAQPRSAEPPPEALPAPGEQDPEAEPEPGQGEQAFLRLSEQIQRRLSTLKQL
jgi:flagellar biogenesis protein FliO